MALRCMANYLKFIPLPSFAPQTKKFEFYKINDVAMQVRKLSPEEASSNEHTLTESELCERIFQDALKVLPVCRDGKYNPRIHYTRVTHLHHSQPIYINELRERIFTVSRALFSSSCSRNLIIVPANPSKSELLEEYFGV